MTTLKKTVLLIVVVTGVCGVSMSQLEVSSDSNLRSVHKTC